MIPILVFDTETTGLPAFNLPAEDPCQPHIVQLGAILYGPDRRVLSELNLLVKPEGWTIPADASKVHGITTEIADRYGLKLASVIGLFGALAERAELLVAHNYSFDDKMVRRSFHHLGTADKAEAFRARPSYCTMRSSTDILKLPGKYSSFKWPNLQEAHTHFLGKPFEGAHDAMADVRACASVYFAMNPLPTPPTEIEEAP